MKGYRERISDVLAKMGQDKIDPRHIEGFMRGQHGTLDHLSPRYFERDVRIALECIQAGGTEFAETVAQSHGL